MEVTLTSTRAALLARIEQLVVATTTDVHEVDYQGSTYTYPNVRYFATGVPNECGGLLVNFTVHCWSEEASSKQALQLLDTVVDGLHQKSFVRLGVRVQGIYALPSPRVVRDRRMWRGEVNFRCEARAA